MNIQSYESTYYRPPSWPGLEQLVRFPDGEFKRATIPNSTIWVFQKENHQFRPEIHAGDIGCGMSAFLTSTLDTKEATDLIADYLKTTGEIGRGNHFVDVCGPIELYHENQANDYSLILVHTHGHEKEIPSTIPQALEFQGRASQARKELGQTLLEKLGVKGEIMADWPHNTLEITPDEKIIYRKGVVKIEPEKLYLLPAHLGAKILVYSVCKGITAPYNSMPHATGRSGPRGNTKVTRIQASLVRKMVYVPNKITDSSLRSEHPSCFNGYDKILNSLGKFIYPIGDIEIRGYVGKV